LSDLSSSARRALEQARGGIDPSPERLARIQAALERATATSSPELSVRACGNDSGKEGVRALSGKLFAAGAAIGVAAAMTWWLTRPDAKFGVQAPPPRAAETTARTVFAPPPLSEIAAVTSEVARPVMPTSERTSDAATRKEPRMARAKRALPLRASGAAAESTLEAAAPSTGPRLGGAPISALQPVAPIDEPSEPSSPPSSEGPLRSAVEHHGPTRVVAPSASREPPRDRLREEIALIRSARGALARREPARALALLERHAAQFSEGVLRKERMASEVLALCMSSRFQEAEQKVQVLSQLAGTSVQVQDLRTACPTLAGRTGP
jgi:hypothetical protein